MILENSIIEDTKNPKSKKAIVYKTIILVFCVYSLISFFCKCIKYTLEDHVYNLSLFQILKDKGLLFRNDIIYFPLVEKAIILLMSISFFLGVYFLIIDKLKFASYSFLILSITIIGSMLFASSIDFDKGSMSITFSFLIILMFIFNILNVAVSALIYSKEKLSEIIFFLSSCISIGFVALITLYMLICGLPAIFEIGFFNFILGNDWQPSNNIYGILPLILCSFSGTLGAIIIGVPIGILTAVFLAEISPNNISNIIRPLIQLLAGIPSVVYGFFGMLFIVPIIRNIFKDLSVGDSLLAVIIILSIMILPTVITISESSLRSVPISYKEASLALGATPIRTIFKITIPAAKSGILSAVILGVGRAIGETMAVIMVAGNVVNMPSILGSVRLLTTGIVLEMSYSSGLHRQALFAIGLVLFVFIMIVNISFSFISRRSDLGAKK